MGILGNLTKWLGFESDKITELPRSGEPNIKSGADSYNGNLKKAMESSNAMHSQQKSIQPDSVFAEKTQNDYNAIVSETQKTATLPRSSYA